MGVQIPQRRFWNPKCRMRMSSDGRPDGRWAVVGRLSDGCRTAVGRSSDDRWTAIGRPYDGCWTLHRTVEKCHFRCSCTFIEGSPHLTVPPRSLFFDTFLFWNCRKYMRLTISPCIFFYDFCSSFWCFCSPQKNVRTAKGG